MEILFLLVIFFSVLPPPLLKYLQQFPTALVSVAQLSMSMH